MNQERRTILYTGHVQGVGFRWTAIRQIETLPLTGYVRNLHDGRVELVVEGEPHTIEEALSRIRSTMAGHITNERAEASAATGEFRSLEIRR